MYHSLVYPQMKRALRFSNRRNDSIDRRYDGSIAVK
jgi:hypothetical protein